MTRNYFENLVGALENGLSDVDSQSICNKTSSKTVAGTSKSKGGKGKGSSKTGTSLRNAADDSGNWACDQCTYVNARSANTCQMCHQRR